MKIDLGLLNSLANDAAAIVADVEAKNYLGLVTDLGRAVVDAQTVYTEIVAAGGTVSCPPDVVSKLRSAVASLRRHCDAMCPEPGPEPGKKAAFPWLALAQALLPVLEQILASVA